MKCDILKIDNSRIITREGSKVEFKESFHWAKAEKYSKTMAAFANNKGGHIIFGIKDTPRELIGLRNNDFEQKDEAIITGFLNSYFSPEISFKKYVCEINEYNLGILEVEKSENSPIICTKQCSSGTLKESDIYYRYNSRTEKIKYPELNILFDRIKKTEQDKWHNILKSIAKISSESVVISGESKNSTNIHITDDPDAMIVRMDDKAWLKNYPLTYKDLVSKLKERYIDFSTNSKFYKLKAELESNENLCHINYLDINNKVGSNKKYYSENILKEFDKHYTKQQILNQIK